MKELPEPNHGNLPAKYQYVEVPTNEPANEPETGGLIEYWHILRRRKGTVLLVAILGTIAGVLFSLPQTPIYQARATLEMLNINEDLLNRRQLESTTTQDYYDPQFNIKTQISILQSKTLGDRVNEKLKPKFPSAKPDDTSRVAAWRKFLGLESKAPAAPAKGKKDGVERAGRQPVGAGGGGHAAGAGAVRLAEPEVRGRLREHDRQRVHRPERGSALPGVAEDGRVADAADRRSEDQAGTQRGRTAALRAHDRIAVHGREGQHRGGEAEAGAGGTVAGAGGAGRQAIQVRAGHLDAAGVAAGGAGRRGAAGLSEQDHGTAAATRGAEPHVHAGVLQSGQDPVADHVAGRGVREAAGQRAEPH